MACIFTKSQLEEWRGYWDLSTSGNCWFFEPFRVLPHRQSAERHAAEKDGQNNYLCIGTMPYEEAEIMAPNRLIYESCGTGDGENHIEQYFQ